MQSMLRLLFFPIIIALSLLGGLSSSCTSDVLPPVEVSEICDTLVTTYDTNIKPIIDTYCAYSGCHVGSSCCGDFRSYQGMLSRLESGQVETRAILTRDMPPNYATGPQTLSDEDYEYLQCWIKDSYPEN